MTLLTLGSELAERSVVMSNDVAAVGSVSVRATSSTRAAGGPCRHQATNSSTCVVRSLGVGAYRPVGLVADPAGQAEAGGLAGGVPAEGDALHLTGDVQVDGAGHECSGTRIRVTELAGTVSRRA